MDAGLLDVLHHTADQYLAGVIADGVDVDLDGVGKESVDQHRPLGREPPSRPRLPKPASSRIAAASWSTSWTICIARPPST